MKKDFKLSAIPKEPNNIISKNPTKSILFLKWKRWFANHPTNPYKHLREYVPVMDIAHLLGYEPTTVMSYLYAYKNKEKLKKAKGYRILYIKHEIAPNGKGDAKFLVTLKNLIDFIVEQDYRDRFYDTTPHDDKDNNE